MRDETRVVRAGLPPATQGGAFRPGPVFAGPFHAAGDPAASPFTYGRFHNPTWSAYEAAVGDLEGGTALAFASGMAAATAILASVLKPRDVLLLMAESYYTIRTLVRGFLSEFGIEARLVPTTARLNAAQLRGVKFGGIHTTAERRARWGGDAIGEGFIRLSAGCEHIDDLLADLGGAFDRLRA